MKTHLTALACIASSLASAQTVTSVYNRDTHEPFKLKNVKVESTVIGPIVRTSAWLTYENPYKKPTEATLNFELPDAAALSGFAYRYGDEYVAGRLMDKAKAWSIYTAITSRNRDPGIMEQWSPTTYHCQIFPIKQGRDLRVRLWTVGMLRPSGYRMALPKPLVPNAVSHYRRDDDTIAKNEWTVRSVRSAPVVREGEDYFTNPSSPVTAVAQRFKDGRTYVAGIVRSGGQSPYIQIDRAYYEPASGEPGGAEVTARVAQLVDNGAVTINATNTAFGDTAPGILKRLRVEYRVGGQEKTATVRENAVLDLIPEAPGASEPTVRGLRQPRTVRLDGQTFAFSGWVARNRTLSTTVGGKAMSFRPQEIVGGADAARLWAQQTLAKGNWKGSRDVLAFSMKYGVPSSATALLAVPQAEMARYRAKEKEFQQAQAEERKRALAQERQARAWAKAHPQNWNDSGGGDPEIRVSVPGAVRVEAILPDRRVIELKADGDVWGGNFEIPAAAAEGTYTVRIVAHMKDGATVERSWTYRVDRTAPLGSATYADGVLTVVSEAGLSEVAAYGKDGTRWLLREGKPGEYRGEAPRAATVVLKDKAGNKGEAAWSSRRS